jgi:hypothetical protein
MKFLRIREWDRLQHYKHRSPPWIKLHRDFMRSPAWVSGDDASRTLAVACMMLAAETDNRIPFDPTYIRRVAYLNQDPNFDQLIAVQFIEVIDASNSLADCKRGASDVHTNAMPEKSREETEKRESQSREEKPRCALCFDRGLRYSKAHPGRENFCTCVKGGQLQHLQKLEQTGTIKQ